MINELAPFVGILFFSREIAQQLVGGNDFPELVHELIVGPIVDLVLKEKNLFLIDLSEK